MTVIHSKLRRTVINEGELYKLRRLTESTPDPRYYDLEKGTLKLRDLCQRDLGVEIGDKAEFLDSGGTEEEWLEYLEKEFIGTKSAYCGLFQLSQTLNMEDPHLGEMLDRNISFIYDFLRKELQNENRRKFHGLMSRLLRHDNPANSINLVADYIKSSTDNDETRYALDMFRFTKQEIKSSDLESFLKDVKYKQYAKYEKSFIGDYFKRKATYPRFNYRSSIDERNLVNRISEILTLDSSEKIEQAILMTAKGMFESIEKNYNPKDMSKSDLECIKPLYDTKGNLIIEKGDLVEVKKIDYQADSYLSEFFAIYKNPNLDEIAHTKEFISVYNRIIDILYMTLNRDGDHMLSTIKESFAGIMYDENHFIKKEDITLYWSNKGQRRCDKHRLSIRYRVNKSDISGYILSDGVFHKKDFIVKIKNDFVFCPISGKINF